MQSMFRKFCLLEIENYLFKEVKIANYQVNMPFNDLIN